MKLRYYYYYYVIEISEGVYFSGVSKDSENHKCEITIEINKAYHFDSHVFAQEILQKYKGKIKTVKITYEVGDLQ